MIFFCPQNIYWPMEKGNVLYGGRLVFYGRFIISPNLVLEQGKRKSLGNSVCKYGRSLSRSRTFNTLSLTLIRTFHIFIYTKNTWVNLCRGKGSRKKKKDPEWTLTQWRKDFCFCFGGFGTTNLVRMWLTLGQISFTHIWPKKSFMYDLTINNL